MKLKHKIIAYSMIPAFLGVGLLSVSDASAHGLFGGLNKNLTPDEIASRQLDMFENEAKILGVSVDEVKDAWAAGKSLAELAKDKGITQDQLQAKIKDARLQQIKTQLQALVAKGVITQSQADKRLATIQNQQNNIKNKMGRREKHGMSWLGL
jgi:hypothetical protein